VLRGLGKTGLLEARGAELSALQLGIDAALIFAAHFVCVQAYGEEWRVANTIATVLAACLFGLIAEFTGVYRRWRGSTVREEVVVTLATWGLTFALLLFLGFATKSSETYSRVVSVGWFLATPGALCLWRAALRVSLGELRRRGYNTRVVAIVGATPTAERLLETIESQPKLGLRVSAVYDDRRGSRRYRLTGALGDDVEPLDRLVEEARSGRVDIVYLALPLRAEARAAQLIRRLADTTVSVYLVPDFRAYDLLRARWSSLGEIQVASIFDTPFDGLGGWAKRAEDILLGSIFLLLTAVPMLLIALAIKLTSRGPVLFRQRRYGLNGKEIYVWKFRTMTVCEDSAEVRQATKNDSRVTPVGAFLRRTSLDELPQFFNVLLGEMSIVGPRPHAVAHNELYRGKIHGYMLRHKVKPGITGWAQVNGWRGETDTVEKMEQRIAHDLYYIHNWRLAWDLYIILRTVFGRKVWNNAY
jgi:putative colanic acid biosynthesis UDP-glucose lipid carrier transferase